MNRITLEKFRHFSWNVLKRPSFAWQGKNPNLTTGNRTFRNRRNSKMHTSNLFYRTTSLSKSHGNVAEIENVTEFQNIQILGSESFTRWLVRVQAAWIYEEDVSLLNLFSQNDKVPFVGPETSPNCGAKRQNQPLRLLYEPTIKLHVL